jgi:hypothetical protein
VLRVSKIGLISERVGLGSGLTKTPSWGKAFTGNNVGGLIMAAYEPLGRYFDQIM